MRIVVQRVKRARVTVDGRISGEIGRGYLLLVGIGKDDERSDLEYLAGKIAGLRIFEDDNGKMNLNIKQVGGRVLSVSQFTLYADTRKGNRPGFGQSADPETAESYWKTFNDLLRKKDIDVREGVFGARMEVELLNDGPVTIWLDSRERPRTFISHN